MGGMSFKSKAHHGICSGAFWNCIMFSLIELLTWKQPFDIRLFW
jgi:hypothetical protein